MMTKEMIETENDEEVNVIGIYIELKGGFWLKVKAKILTFFLKPFVALGVTKKQL